MSELISNMLSGTFISSSMKRREERIRTARKDSERMVRDLRRDRGDLERKEKGLMTQMKKFIEKGDFPKAHLIAKQVAAFRSAADRNFGRSVFIQTEAQLMLSNHKVNRAHVETLKSFDYANLDDSPETARQRHYKNAMRSNFHETVENIMNEGFDDVYESVESHRTNPDYYNAEIEAIIKECINPKKKTTREYVDPEISSKMVHTPIQVILCNYDIHKSSDEGVIMKIPNTDISVDMLKRLMIKDTYVMEHLGLSSTFGRRTSTLSETSSSSMAQPLAFKVGVMILSPPSDEETDPEQGENESEKPHGVTPSPPVFSSFRLTDSLNTAGIRDGSVLWIQILKPRKP